MRPVTVTVGPLAAASANNIALSQTLGAAGKLTLNGTLASGGVATLDTARRIGIHSNGNDSSLTWTIVGTNCCGAAITETLTGATTGNTVQSVLDYMTVTSISGNAATASTVTVGTTAVASSAWVRLDNWVEPALAIQCVVSGSATYTFEGSFDDPNDLVNAVAPASMAWDSTISPLVGVTASQMAEMPISPLWARTTLTSGTGSVRSILTQYLNAQRSAVANR